MQKSRDVLSRRERQIMDAVYARKAATVAEVLADLPDPPSYSAVRATMRILEEKGFLKHAEEEGRYMYRPTVPRDKAARSALRSFLSSYFDGSLESAVASLLSVGRDGMKREDYDRLIALIEKAREEGNG
jgi:BlaI family transcriptional regulator, penicillinase repressor